MMVCNAEENSAPHRRSVLQQPVAPVSCDARDQARQHNQRGIALAPQGNHREARMEFRLAVRLRPDYAEAQYNLGIELEQLDEFEAAIEAFRPALSLRPCGWRWGWP